MKYAHFLLSLLTLVKEHPPHRRQMNWKAPTGFLVEHLNQGPKATGLEFFLFAEMLLSESVTKTGALPPGRLVQEWNLGRSMVLYGF